MRLAINGFGRIGRTFLRLALAEGFDVVAINDLADAKTMAHLFKYDSVHGVYPKQVCAKPDAIVIESLSIPVFSMKDAGNLPWSALRVDVVIECTGRNLTTEAAEAHIQAGAKQVLISAPAADDIPMLVLGVNDDKIDLASPVLSNASCTTNNIAPMIKILNDNWGVEEGYITTIHSMTGDQNLHDANHKDLRRARAASSSIIPTTTGAAKAITHIFPELDGRLGGAGIRVPVLNGSLTDFTCLLKKKTTIEEINAAFKSAAENELKGILQYTEDPIVSVDIIDSPYSCTFDSLLTSIVGDMVKVVGWYDNEFGYSSRLIDVVKKVDGVSQG
ncbi:MAG: type I glyceraldehyde-3-phosphate dehydrogenase [Chryseobacterium sp.]|uniref:type I glyceraldehyde-3-phosphate dehydrogenase n=1 Tax=Pedobacter agri TaxID=454586 RepID=UPI001227E0E7|nr:type I glyceraldehyde-3-phosphate dehydrogenase [Pedobacter agri]MDQ1141906.1 glyceraldehyde 3-phosphate dehydrogenase [Pedobacter agri]RZJ88270.1 MAG: type I glyceraldehyde-3-phosphate dehydrogenase [Chryseobacterium sp.]